MSCNCHPHTDRTICRSTVWLSTILLIWSAKSMAALSKCLQWLTLTMTSHTLWGYVKVCYPTYTYWLTCWQCVADYTLSIFHWRSLYCVSAAGDNNNSNIRSHGILLFTSRWFLYGHYNCSTKAWYGIWMSTAVTLFVHMSMYVGILIERFVMNDYRFLNTASNSLPTGYYW